VNKIEGLGIDSRERGAALSFEAQVFGDERAVGQGQQPVVAAVDGKPPFGQHAQVVGIEAVKV